jgi:multisubunit Na+/H+ antiporter MnhF subunit
LDNPLHVILNKSKLAYRIYVILIANKELKKKEVQDNIFTLKTLYIYICNVIIFLMVYINTKDNEA